jgi:hypothetical protein
LEGKANGRGKGRNQQERERDPDSLHDLFDHHLLLLSPVVLLLSLSESKTRKRTVSGRFFLERDEGWRWR